MSPSEFDATALKVWKQLLPLIPEDLRRYFDRIAILIEDEPTPEILSDLVGTGLGDDPTTLCGLHVGVPLPDESLTMPSLFPARVYLFRNALLDLVDYDGSTAALEELREEIAITLLHEIGHFFGLEEVDLERLGFD